MLQRRRREAFTLVEIMVVVVILGILATVVTVKVIQYVSRSRVETARTQVRELVQALELYKMDHKAYPESLESLLEKTDEHPEGILDAIPVDPWGNEYEYVSDTEHGFDLVSYGRDGQEGGEGEDADIKSYELVAGTTLDEGGEPVSNVPEEGER